MKGEFQDHLQDVITNIQEVVDIRVASVNDAIGKDYAQLSDLRHANESDFVFCKQSLIGTLVAASKSLSGTLEK
jgi:hypothetical protein